jgi:ribosome biogenesis GTPase
MTARVLKSTGSWYDVITADGRRLAARTRGKLRLHGYNETNPVAVGDEVELEFAGSEAVIVNIRDRRNHLVRQSVKKMGQAHTLAANIDQALLVITQKYPRTSAGFIDRFLATAEAYRIPQLLLLNKVDLLSSQQLEEAGRFLHIYRQLPVPVFTAALTGGPLPAELCAALTGKTTLVAGHSGVGKSTLLNLLNPGIAQRTREISAFSEKGAHSTTFAEMFAVDADTFVIDTPGIKEWGLIDMEPHELSDYFVEMRALRLQCRFGARCLHLQEPGCAVRAAVEAGTVAPSRYRSYCSMVAGEDNRK